jgi:Na+/melibiose symporter-like transporter
MSVTHPTETFVAPSQERRSGEGQLAPFLLAVAIFAVVVGVALWFTGLPQ